MAPGPSGTYRDKNLVTGPSTPAVVEVQWEHVRRCPLCGSERLRPWRARCRDASALVTRTLDYVACADCGSRPMSPRPTNATVGALYGATYAPYVHRRADAAVLVGGAGYESPLKAQLSAAYLDGPTGRRVLDFGCGTSDFLDAAREAGWRTVGCDFSAHGVESTRAAGHETRVVTDSFWDWLGAERFDAIRLNHVIEHLHHPGAQLNKLMQSLEPGGLLHIVTPNPDGAACRLFRRSSLFFEAVHLTLLPPAALTRSAVSAGAKDVVIVDEHGSKDLWRSWQLSRRRASNYTHAEQEPQRAWQRRALRILARFTARPDRYHAFIRA